jgi:GGDEF domain-containing protein
MLSRLRDTDTLARVGEQAFGLLLPACPREVSERILGTLEESVRSMTFAWQGRPYPLSARIGIVHVPPFAGAYDECQALASNAAASKA